MGTPIKINNGENSRKESSSFIPQKQH